MCILYPARSPRFQNRREDQNYSRRAFHQRNLFQSLKSEEGGVESAKSLIAKYGVAYIATSIPLTRVSFIVCYYFAVAGVEVGELLANIGITNAGDTGEKAGTFDIAYVADTTFVCHKDEGRRREVSHPPSPAANLCG